MCCSSPCLVYLYSYSWTDISIDPAGRRCYVTGYALLENANASVLAVRSRDTLLSGKRMYVLRPTTVCCPVSLMAALPQTLSGLRCPYAARRVSLNGQESLYYWLIKVLRLPDISAGAGASLLNPNVCWQLSSASFGIHGPRLLGAFNIERYELTLVRMCRVPCAPANDKRPVPLSLGPRIMPAPRSVPVRVVCQGGTQRS